ncbi:hypothetical protein [Legionella impletisoli]|nr:hypothetical protein [Legionella impletisoli]
MRNYLFHRLIIFFSFWMSYSPIHSETITSITTNNYKIDERYTVNGRSDIMEKTWQDVCKALGMKPTDIPGGEFCVNPSGNAVYVQSGDLCADGSFKIPLGAHWCEAPVPSCPNASWTLSNDQKTCSRPDFSCWIKIDSVSEEKLLAAIAYGESSTMDNYEEMAGIAYAVIRRRNAARKSSVASLLKAFPSFSYVISDGNYRFRKLMCSDIEENFEKPYHAARNALYNGFDYANGGCFWDGYDLKTSGKQHYKYQHGFKFTSPSHNLFSINEPPHRRKETDLGSYDHEYDSTAAYGKTIFWKLNKEFLKAKRKKQCQ